MREGYKKTEVGVIPEDWEVKRLDILCELIDGDRSSNYPSGDDIVDSGILFLSTSNIKNSKLDYSSSKFITKEKFDSLRKGKLQKDDIIITLRGSIGSVAKFNADKFETGFINAQMLIIRSKSIISNYLYSYLISTILKKQLEEISSGSAQPQLTKRDLSAVKIIVPSIKEQEKIAEILSTVNSQIDDTEKLIEKSKELKKGLMQKLLTKGIGHSEFKKTEVGEIPASWEVYKFFDTIDKIIDFRGRTPKKLGLDWGDGDILALSANNVKMGKIDFEIENYFGSDKLYEKWMSGNELCKNDILMTMEAPLGNVALVPNDNKYILSQRVVSLKTKAMINNKFMLYMLMSDMIQNQFNMLSTGTTAKGINQKNLAKVKVIVPSLEEQINISKILLSLDNEIEEYENKKQNLEGLKKGLMKQLLTGKIRVI